MNDNHLERVADAAAAENAMKRWLGPAFDAVVGHYRERLEHISGTTPWDKDKLASLGMAIFIAGQMRKQIEAVISDGKVALETKRHREQIESIPHEKRRWLGI